MTPYYAEPGITIYHGDCRNVLPELPEADLILTDPPYGVSFRSKVTGHGYADDSDSHEERIIPLVSLFRKQARKVAVSPGIKWCWLYPRPDWILCWHKPFSVGPSPFGFNNWEPILFYGKGEYGDRRSDYFRATFVREPNIGHPCPKPQQWALSLISILSTSGVIIDPMMGSGTTVRAAKDLGRQAIGIEIEERYCEIAVKRLRQEVLPLGAD